MSVLRTKFMQNVEVLSDDVVRLPPEVGRQIAVPPDQDGTAEKISSVQKNKSRRLGSLKGQKLIADGHDIDECNDEIAELFGVK